MTRLTSICVLFLTAVVAFGAEPFDGTWQIDLKATQFPQKPSKWEIVNGVYKCSTCDPVINVKADGSDQKVIGSPYYDTISVQVIDTQTAQVTRKKGGKISSTAKLTVDQNGNRLTLKFAQYPESSQQPVTGTSIYARVEKGPAGAHATSGAWRQERAENFSENTRTITIKSTGDGLSLSSPTGVSYTAKFDGKEYPMKGDPGVDTVSLRRVDGNTFEETDKRAGEVIEVDRMTVSADGRSMTVVAERKKQGTTTTFVARKQ